MIPTIMEERLPSLHTAGPQTKLSEEIRGSIPIMHPEKAAYPREFHGLSFVLKLAGNDIFLPSTTNSLCTIGTYFATNS
jgi:hypothetical protein